MTASLVLQIVVENSVLDLFTIDQKIRALSKDFQVIGTKAMEEHATYQQGLKRVNSDFKFHYCSLCEKPHKADGSWKEDLCCCDLDETLHAQEINRRIRLRAVGDPRLDPSFASLSAKTKSLRMTAFAGGFSCQAMECIGRSGWLYRMSALPFDRLGLIRLHEWNPTAFNFLSICVYVEMLHKEFCSVAPRCTTLLDLALQVFQNPSEVEWYQELLNDDVASMETFIADEEKLKVFILSIHESFLKIFSLYAAGNDNVLGVDLLKNLGNSIGMFLTDRENNAQMFLEKDFYERMLRRLPETFVWTPIYGGSREDYVPPVNQFAHYATQG